MTVQSGSDYESIIHAEQAGKIGDNLMGHHEMAAYCAGFPPGGRCVATPEEFRAGLENGTIEVAFSPLSLAKEVLDSLVGPQQAFDLGGTFGGASVNADVDPGVKVTQDSILDFTRSV